MLASGRPDINEILDDVLAFKISFVVDSFNLSKLIKTHYRGQFCLTEVGHGLDVIHLETTATLLSTGDFELNTPHEDAAKYVFMCKDLIVFDSYRCQFRYMPPTSPMGMQCIAIVYARTIVNGDDHGVKPFVVRLHDGNEMSSGVVCKCVDQTDQ